MHLIWGELIELQGKKLKNVMLIHTKMGLGNGCELLDL
ncbi:hypothetical protein PMAN_a1168 [Pseudoalteromonas marina]|jgi:hypothetical protein|nr:hypothetical protein PMAN_a1168 [Pseudoalteromonas marina]GAA74340.1 hypothetical protein P20480_0800 [Pseudoalteromonas sp. BSi20480]